MESGDGLGSVLYADGMDGVVTHPADALESTGGYAVTLVETVDAAIDAFDSGSFDCLVTDTDLAGGDVTELVAWVRENVPGLPVVVVGADALDVGTLLDGMVSRLEGLGMDVSTIETRVERDRGPLDAITNAADAFDVVVMGESDPSLTTFVFGMPADQVADRFLGPVLVVQREPPEETQE